MSDGIISPVERIGAVEAALPIMPMENKMGSKYGSGFISVVNLFEQPEGSLVAGVHNIFHSKNFLDGEIIEKAKDFYESAKKESASPVSFESKQKYAEKLMEHLAKSNPKISLREHLKGFKADFQHEPLGSWRDHIHTVLITQRISTLSLSSPLNFTEEELALEEEPLFVKATEKDQEEKEKEQEQQEENEQEEKAAPKKSKKEMRLCKKSLLACKNK